MNKSKLPIFWISNLIHRSKTLNPKFPILNPNRYLHNSSNPIQFSPIPIKPPNNFPQIRQFCGLSEAEESKLLRELFTEVEREENNEREAKRKAGIPVNDAEIEEEDYMGVNSLIEKLDKKLNNPNSKYDDLSSTESDSETEREKDYSYREEKRKATLLHDRICKRHRDLIKSFENAKTAEDAFNFMNKINKFEEKHFRLIPEYRVIGDLMDRFKVATGKDKFVLAQKLNRAMRMVQNKEQFNPDDPMNYGVMQRQDDAEATDNEDGERPMDDDDVEFDYMKERDDILLEKVSEIDKKLEEKLAALDYTFGKKGKVLEEEIRDLAEERNTLTEKKKRAMYRKGFGIQLIDVNRTCKVTKGGQVVKYTAILVCGNYNGIVGFAKAKGPAVPVAVQKAREKCFQNLHYIDRYEELTIPHAIQTTYKKTKVYLWPAKTTTGLKAGKIVETILKLAGFKNVKSKVIGSRNPHNTVKAVFQALNAIETPKDVQEKFGRTVIETHLL